jgi:hypothetical protein
MLKVESTARTAAILIVVRRARRFPAKSEGKQTVRLPEHRNLASAENPAAEGKASNS